MPLHSHLLESASAYTRKRTEGNLSLQYYKVDNLNGRPSAQPYSTVKATIPNVNTTKNERDPTPKGQHVVPKYSEV